MKVFLCFLWHMHQPYYKDPESGTYILPWVRLHAIKDYVALPRIFRKFPSVRHTVNLVPSLLVQVKDYVENGAEDIFLALSRKNALDLNREEEDFLLSNFFSAFPPTMILPQPRFEDLYMRQENARRAIGKPGQPGGFGASEYTDLMTLFNLTWFHPLLREEDQELSRLWRKGRGFTEREKNYVLDKQIEIMAMMMPEYRKMVEENGGELSSSPMYHPILPLIIDNHAARDALPGATLPDVAFAEHVPFAIRVVSRRDVALGRVYQPRHPGTRRASGFPLDSDGRGSAREIPGEAGRKGSGRDSSRSRLAISSLHCRDRVRSPDVVFPRPPPIRPDRVRVFTLGDVRGGRRFRS
ncbi:MAG: hypothetical protein HW408_1628 [Actinobacteria bacterium]|nr:hypothetical protein [Actinomycetota bacterium]